MADYISLGQAGDLAGAREGLQQLWEANREADPVTRCGLAHSLADVQESPRAELEWDLRALTSALEAADADVAALGMTQGVAGLMPSLHLNLADVYRRVGQPDVAKGHALQARAALASIEATPYFEEIDRSVERVLMKLRIGDTD